MPVPLIALLAAALHQAQRGWSDGAATERTISLLGRAVGGAEVTLEVSGPGLLVNGTPVDSQSPGVGAVRQMLRTRELCRLEIPAGVDAARWGELVQLFAAAAGLYPTTAHLRAALHAIVPTATLTADEDLDSGPGQEGSEKDLGRTAHPVHIGGTSTDRAELSVRLDPLLARGRKAWQDDDMAALSAVLLELRELEKTESPVVAAIVTTERKKLASLEVLERMAQLLPHYETAPIIRRALFALGHDAAHAIINSLQLATTRIERRAYLGALTEHPESNGVVLNALKGREPQLLADAAEVAGLRTLELAIPGLEVLLRHTDEGVRTAAWRALEQIGTPTAMAVLGR